MKPPYTLRKDTKNTEPSLRCILNTDESNSSLNLDTSFSTLLEMAPPANPPATPAPKLSFISGDEIKKFVGCQTSYDTAFSPGPSIEEFLEAFKGFCERHDLKTDADKIVSLKMQVHPSMGDARFVLSSLLDSNINQNIPFTEVVEYLRRAYKTTSSINMYRASQNFINLCKPKNSFENDFLMLRSIELSCRELLEAFTGRDAYANSTKSPEEKIIEILSLIAFSAYAGEKISKKLSKDSVSARELVVRTKEELRLAELKEKQEKNEKNGLFSKNENVFTMEKQTEQNKQTGFNKQNNHRYSNSGSYRNSNSQGNNPRNSQFNHGARTGNKIVCHKCGQKSHIAKECRTTVELHCAKCLRNGHVQSVCFSKQNFRMHDRN